MARGPRLQPVVLTNAELAQLTTCSRRPKTAHALAERAKMILASAPGATSVEVAAAMGVDRNTIGKWRSRFLAHRLDGLLDAPRPGAPRTITDGDVERVIRKTLEERPPADEATHWSTRTMARAAGVTQTAVVRIWHAYGLQPHREETFKLSTDPLFIDKVRDVVGLYLQPPDRALVLCVDEKTQVQALDGPRQLQYTQGPDRETVADPASALPSPLHADVGLVAQSGRDLVFHLDATPAPARRPSQCRGVGSRAPRLRRPHQRNRAAIPLDEERR